MDNHSKPMCPSNTTNLAQPKTTEKEEDQNEELVKHLKSSLPVELWFNWYPVYQYQGFWCSDLEPTLAFQNHFQAQPSDIFITSFRKTGTTWLKALLFSLVDRATHPLSESPLLSHNPHELIPHLETNIYTKSNVPDLKTEISPRMFGTHLPFHALPTSMKDSNCKMVYIYRNPLDTFISSWFFYLNFDVGKTVKPDMIGEYLDKFIEGKYPYGAYEDHVLGYWKERVRNPNKVFFVKYEDLKADPKRQLKLLAEFVGRPFSKEEEELGVVDGIVELCSFEKMKEMEPKTKKVYDRADNKWFFRKAEVGDWVNYLTPSMAQKLENFMEDKLAGSGFTFK